jgi:hypothetical protein
MSKETTIFVGKGNWSREAYIKLKGVRVIFDCSDGEYGPVEFDIALLIQALNKHTSEHTIFTYPKKIPDEVRDSIMEDVARQVKNWKKSL